MARWETAEAPEGYGVRPPAKGDLKAVAALILASDLADFGEPDYPDEELRADWEDLDLENDAFVITSPDGEAVGYASVERRTDAQFVVEGYVHPEHYGRGIGTCLVRLTEGRVRDNVARAPEGTRFILDNAINGHSPAACRLLEENGYEPARHFWRMTTELDEPPPEAEMPEGMTIRTCVPGRDERLFYGVLDEAFRDHWEHKPRTFEEWEKRKKRLGFDPGLWLLATTSEGEAMGAAVCVEVDGAGEVDELGVRRSWRGRGLALALLRSAFRMFRERGLGKAVLYVDSQSLTGATRVYERAGMGVDRLYSVYRKELVGGAAPDESP